MMVDKKFTVVEYPHDQKAKFEDRVNQYLADGWKLVNAEVSGSGQSRSSQSQFRAYLIRDQD